MHRPLALLLLLGVAGVARAGTITAELNRTEAPLGEALVMTVNVEGVRDGDPVVPQVPGLVINHQGTSESTIFSNGRRVSELQLTYVVYPQQSGTFTIPSVTVQVDGKQEASLPLTVKVGPPGQGSQAQTAPPPAPGSQAPASPPPRNGKMADTGGVFIERECSNLNPYVGEQIICAIRVYHKGNLNGGERLPQSSADFRRFNVDGEKRYQKVVNGQRYAVIEIKEVVIPTKAGALELPPFGINARVLTYTKRNNPMDKLFDQFGGGVFNFDLSFTEEKEVTVKSDVTKIDAKPVPDAGKPKGYAGLVGNFELAASASRPQLPAGETVTITISITGEGVTDAMPDPVLGLESVGKVYADKPEYKEEVNPDKGIRSTRTYKFALVPAKPGTYPLGAVEVPVFQPKLGQYVTLKADLGRLIVDPGKAEEKALVVGQTTAAPGISKEDVKVLGKDMLGLHKNVSLTAEQTITTADQIVFTALGTTPIAFAFGAFGFLEWRDRQRGNVHSARRSRAFRTFRTAIAAATAELTAGRVEPALLQAHTALRDYLGDKLGLHGRSLAAREIDDQLARLSTPKELREQAASLIAKLEQIEFGGRAPDAGPAAELIQSLDQLVGGIEKA